LGGNIKLKKEKDGINTEVGCGFGSIDSGNLLYCVL